MTMAGVAVRIALVNRDDVSLRTEAIVSSPLRSVVDFFNATGRGGGSPYGYAHFEKTISHNHSGSAAGMCSRPRRAFRPTPTECGAPVVAVVKAMCTNAIAGGDINGATTAL
jgi:hypothetical protein